MKYSKKAIDIRCALPIGLVVVGNVRLDQLAHDSVRLKATALDEVAVDQEGILKRIELFQNFFSQHGHVCPLAKQFQMTAEKGFPSISPLVDVLLTAEMSTGILMGVQDFGAMKGELLFDVAGPGETFGGMRSQVICNENEIVIRDDIGILASYLQGSDKRTMVTKMTESAIYFVFGVPGLLDSEVKEASEALANYFKAYSASVRVEFLSPTSCSQS